MNILRPLALLLAVAAMISGAYIAVGWAPDRTLDELTPRWAGAPSQFVMIDGMRVHLRDEGPRADKQPLVLLHGTSASLHTWDAWADALKQHRRVIRLDLPGFGLTGPWPDQVYTLERYARWMGAVFDAMQIRRCVLVGNSLGGEVAWMTAIVEPRRVSKLVLIDAGGYPLPATSIPIGFRLAQLPTLGPLVQHFLPRSMVESSVRNVYGDPSRVTPELIDRYYELSLREGNRAALIERFKQMPRGAQAARIVEVKQPTLILWGAQDRLIPPAVAQSFQRDIAQSQVVVLDGLGHVPHEEDPLRTLAALKAFLTPGSAQPPRIRAHGDQTPQ